MDELKVFTHPYLGIYTKCFLWETEHYNVWIDGGIGSGWAEHEHYLHNGKKNVLLMTHGHWDHVCGVAKVQHAGGALYAHRGDVRYYTDPAWHWQVLFGQFTQVFEVPSQRRVMFDETVFASRGIDVEIHDGDILTFDDLRLRVITTPGHSHGSVCYLEETTGTLLTGDSLSDTGFFAGPLQLVDVDAYIASMEKLSQLVVDKVITDHTPDLPGAELAAYAQKGAESAKTMRTAVEQYVARTTGELSLAEVGKAAAGSIGKNMGGGACVTALAILCKMADPRAQACASRYISGQ